MIIVPVPRRFIRSHSWAQTDTRKQLQRSEWTGRTRELAIGPADRWSCQADVRPTRPGDIETWRALQARMKQPGAAARVPVDAAGQLPADSNIVANPDLAASAAGWVLPAATARIADQFPSPVEWFFRADPGAARSIQANNGNDWPALAGSVFAVESWVFRTDSGITCNIALQWLNASMGVISTSTVVLAPTAGSWAYARGSLTAPALTAFVRIRYDVGAFGSGYLGVTGLRVSLLPTKAAVNGAGQSGQALALTGLGRGIRNLRAGQLLTVPLPGGDEQLIALTEDLVGDSSGNGTAALGSPMRQSPAAGAVVELDRPWALMRATDPLAWSQSPGAIFSTPSLQLEEWF